MSTPPTDLVTIYKLTFKGRAVYTGRTKDLARRLRQHAGRTSSCRMVRQAFKRYGRDKFGIESLVLCRPEDADANESYYIEANGTMYPNGYNLRHGATAGAEAVGENRLMEAAEASIVPFTGEADETRAYVEAWTDVADILETKDEEEEEHKRTGEDKDGSSVYSSVSAVDRRCEAVLRERLRVVHPDRSGERTYTSSEVTAMLTGIIAELRD